MLPGCTWNMLQNNAWTLSLNHALLSRVKPSGYLSWEIGDMPCTGSSHVKKGEYLQQLDITSGTFIGTRTTLRVYGKYVRKVYY